MAESYALRRVVYLLVLKSLVELVLVSALALAYYLNSFPPFLHGSLDEVSSRGASGWAVSQSMPGGPVEVQLYIDGKYASEGIAQLPRPDIKNAGESADGNVGFYLHIPTLSRGEHEARVYALHETRQGSRTLLIVGKPTRFEVSD